MVQYLDGVLGQIWVYDPEQKVLVPRAGTGPLMGANDPAFDLPVVILDADGLRCGTPVLIKNLADDARLADQGWAKRGDVVSFAAYPLVLEDRLVGAMSLFSTGTLTEATLNEMGSVAHGIALCIERKRSELALDASEGKYRLVVENIREVIYQMDEFGHWTFLNPAWTEATGFTVAESIGTFFLDFIHHDDREHNRHIFLELIERKSTGAPRATSPLK